MSAVCLLSSWVVLSHCWQELDKCFRQAGLRYTQALWPQNISEVFAAK